MGPMRFPLMFVAMAAVFAVAACAPTQHTSSAGEQTTQVNGNPAPSPSASAAATAVPSASSTGAAASPSPESTGSGQPVASASPSISAPPVVMLPPNAAPKIVAINLDRTTVQGGDTVSGQVVTSSNVASVEARIAGFSIGVPKVGVGKFALVYNVPNVPFFFRRTYTMEVIARNTAGVQTTRTIPITVR